MSLKQLIKMGPKAAQGFWMLQQQTMDIRVVCVLAAAVMALVLSACLKTAWAQSSANARFSLGAGVDNVLGSAVDDRPGGALPYVSMDVTSARLTEPVDVRVSLGTDLSPFGGWFGVGATLGLGLSDTPLFLEASLMPGLWVDFDHQYRTGAFEQGLGHPLEFRSQIGVGWQIDPVSAILVTLSHKSNANIPGGVSNPGMEAFQVRYSQSF